MSLYPRPPDNVAEGTGLMTDQPAKPVAGERIPLVDELASVLRERIYQHRYPTGAWLRQEQLSAELGVSRTPLREALRVLEQEGLVRVEAGHGARVVSGDLPTLLAAYQLRAVVDGLAARLACAHPGRDRARHLLASINEQRAAVRPWSPRLYTEANVAFHEQIMYLSGNEFVLAQRPLLRMTAQVFAPVALTEPSGALRAIDEHTAIAEAISAGRSTDAELLARAHIEATVTELANRAAGQPGAS